MKITACAALAGAAFLLAGEANASTVYIGLSENGNPVSQEASGTDGAGLSNFVFGDFTSSVTATSAPTFHLGVLLDSTSLNIQSSAPGSNVFQVYVTATGLDSQHGYK